MEGEEEAAGARRGPGGGEEQVHLVALALQPLQPLRQLGAALPLQTQRAQQRPVRWVALEWRGCGDIMLCEYACRCLVDHALAQQENQQCC